MRASTEIALQEYLDELARTGNRSKSAKHAGTTLATILRYGATDEDFAEAERVALLEAADVLEEEARRRAVEGWLERETRDKDGNTTRVYKFSDSLLAKLLDGALPAKYAQRVKGELSGPDGQPLAVKGFDETAVAAQVASILETARQRKAQASGDLTDDDPLLQ